MFAVLWCSVSLTVNSLSLTVKCLDVFVEYCPSLNIERSTWRMKVDHM